MADHRGGLVNDHLQTNFKPGTDGRPEAQPQTMSERGSSARRGGGAKTVKKPAVVFDSDIGKSAGN